MPDWREQAACLNADPEIFDESNKWATARAKEVCFELCDVRQECMNWALGQPRVGGPVVLGGMTQADRERAKKARNKRRHYIKMKEE